MRINPILSTQNQNRQAFGATLTSGAEAAIDTARVALFNNPKATDASIHIFDSLVKKLGDVLPQTTLDVRDGNVFVKKTSGDLFIGEADPSSGKFIMKLIQAVQAYAKSLGENAAAVQLRLF